MKVVPYKKGEGFLTCFSFSLEQKSVMLLEGDLSSLLSHQ